MVAWNVFSIFQKPIAHQLTLRHYSTCARWLGDTEGDLGIAEVASLRCAMQREKAKREDRAAVVACPRESGSGNELAEYLNRSVYAQTDEDGAQRGDGVCGHRTRVKDRDS